jgi:hypothetical protein
MYTLNATLSMSHFSRNAKTKGLRAHQNQKQITHTQQVKRQKAEYQKHNALQAYHN